MSKAQPHVLVIEDEPAQREVLSYNIKSEGYRVTQAADGEEGLICVADDPPDVVVLDWMMPHVSGIEVCRQLKKNPETKNIPVILLSAKSEDFDKVLGLETGADDYVVKPYSVSELMARIKTQLRRVRPASTGQILSFEDIVLNSETHKVNRAGEDISLGPIEYKLLCCFLERPGRVWSREVLLNRVWGRENYVDTRTVDVHVGRLRKALSNAGASNPIRTVRGAGYALG